MTFALLADVEDQGLATRTAGVVTHQRHRVVGAQRIRLLADHRLGHEGQALQVFHTAALARIKVQLTEQVPEIRYVGSDVDQEAAQALGLQGQNLLPRQVLALLQLMETLNRVMGFQFLVERKDHPRAQSRIQAHFD